VTTYVAFLRGINLGPRNKIAMPALRELATALGYSNVATYINSGNLILHSRKQAATIEREIAAAISDTFGLAIDVAVRTLPQLEAVLANNPYPEGNPSQVTVAFLMEPAGATGQEKVASLATANEPHCFAGRDVYVHYADGIGNSVLAEKFSATVGVSATVRNIRTVGKVVELAVRLTAAPGSPSEPAGGES